jgi:hypothetical protein
VKVNSFSSPPLFAWAFLLNLGIVKEALVKPIERDGRIGPLYFLGFADEEDMSDCCVEFISSEIKRIIKM